VFNFSICNKSQFSGGGFSKQKREGVVDPLKKWSFPSSFSKDKVSLKKLPYPGLQLMIGHKEDKKL